MILNFHIRTILFPITIKERKKKHTVDFKTKSRSKPAQFLKTTGYKPNLNLFYLVRLLQQQAKEIERGS